jgi:two-component system LytT family response regulator
MRAVIIDDELKNIFYLRHLLSKHCPEVEVVGEARNAADGRQVLSHVNADLVFLDIVMPEKTGFDMLASLGSYDFEVIFVTGYDQYGVEAVKCSALDYLMKPLMVMELKNAVAKASSKMRTKYLQDQVTNLLNMLNNPNMSDHRLALRLMYEIRFVNIRDIIRLEAQRSYTKVFLEGSPEAILVSTPLAEFETMLNRYQFIRPHKSWIVNPGKIGSILNRDNITELLLTDGSRVQVARSKKHLIEKLLTNKNINAPKKNGSR